MSLARLRARVPSATSLGCHRLLGHDLRYHKAGQDGSGKCDAFFTGRAEDVVYGVLFEMDAKDKPALDAAEGLGVGYDAKQVSVKDAQGGVHTALTYIALRIDTRCQPYDWYLHHVQVGAAEALLPAAYVAQKIVAVQAIDDPDTQRDAEQRAIHD